MFMISIIIVNNFDTNSRFHLSYCMQDAKFWLRPVSEQLYNFIGDRVTVHISTVFEGINCEA